MSRSARGASFPISHSRSPTEYLPSAVRSITPRSISSASNRYTVDDGSPARLLISGIVSSVRSGLNDSKMRSNLPTTDWPRSWLLPATRSTSRRRFPAQARVAPVQLQPSLGGSFCLT